MRRVNSQPTSVMYGLTALRFLLAQVKVAVVCGCF
jgi:hypothetical protein